MAIMLLENHFKFLPTPPYDYAVIAALFLVIGVIVMFTWRRAELNRMKAEVDRLTQLCQDWEAIVKEQSQELMKEREIRAGLEDAFTQQKKHTEEVLEKCNFLYVAMLKNGTLSRSDLKWLAQKEVDNIMNLFKKDDR